MAVVSCQTAYNMDNSCMKCSYTGTFGKMRPQVSHSDTLCCIDYATSNFINHFSIAVYFGVKGCVEFG